MKLMANILSMALILHIYRNSAAMDRMYAVSFILIATFRLHHTYVFVCNHQLPSINRVSSSMHLLCEAVRHLLDAA